MMYSLQLNINSSPDEFERNLDETVKLLNFVADQILKNKVWHSELPFKIWSFPVQAKNVFQMFQWLITRHIYLISY